ncbi:MAG: ribose 5-phosphate isomerase A [Candidatus Heimdallarchaeota archaeon]|nr:ribose 5-phosphate isomerase A [Candidatus Heimdallarchaeota archaeon]
MNKTPKENAAIYAAKKLRHETFVIFGSGSTVDLIISYLSEIHKSMNELKAVSGSNSTSKQLHDNSIQEITIKELQERAKGNAVICVDGADEVVFDSDNNAKIIIKGHGAALLREKILWEQAKKILVVMDESKLSSQFTKFIPIEIIPFAYDSIINQIKSLYPNVSIKLHLSSDETPLLTDNHNNIIEIHHQGSLNDLQEFHNKVMQITGVVETGVFGDKYIENVSYIIGYKHNVEFID